MQNQQMAAMASMNANAGPGEGTPMMSTMQRPGQPGQAREDPRINLNTYIYDYFIRNKHYKQAHAMLEGDLKMNILPQTKPSPSGRNMNGVDPMEDPDSLPLPKLPEGQSADNSFLFDWWCQFWDIFRAARDKNGVKGPSHQYYQHTRQLGAFQNQQRSERMQMNGAAAMNGTAMNTQQYQNMLRAGMAPNGVPNDLKRAAAMNARNPSNPNQMANMNAQMKNSMLSAAQMQRDGSGMDMNGQRPQSPGSSENAPSPNKRPRVEGNNFNGQPMGARSQGMPQQPMGATSAAQANPMMGMNAGQFGEFAQQPPNVQPKSLEGMNSGVQGSPMTQPGLDGQEAIFSGNIPRPNGMPAGPGAPGQPQGNHALQDYQMQLMLLEQQNKKRLLMARQEQDNMSGQPHGQPPVGAPGFPPSMSPQGSRAGPSPGPNDQMKRGTPKLNPTGLPGSPMPDPSMQQNRNSPAPNMDFQQMPPGFPPQFSYPQMQQNPMMRPPSSHPGGNMNGQPMTQQQQMEMMRAQQNGMPNGAWRGGPPQGMIPQQGQPVGPMGNPQRGNPMPPPPAPPAGEQPRAQEPSPSQPAAPPTPSQTNKAAPKKKATNDKKKPAKSKAAGTGATPAASGEEPPPTPTTPMNAKSFTGQNGQPPQAQPQPPTAAPVPQQQPMQTNGDAPFGNIGGDEADLGSLNFGFDGTDALENFDFDSFLHVGDDNGAFGSLGGDFGFGDGVEAGGEM